MGLCRRVGGRRFVPVGDDSDDDDDETQPSENSSHDLRCVV